MAIQGLWAGPWLRDVAGLSRDAVAVHLLVMALATMAGFLLWGNLTTWLGRRGVPPLRLLAAGVGGFLIVQGLLTWGWTGAPALLWIAFGVFGTAGSVAYAILSRRFPAEQAGRVITALNALVFGAAFALQWSMGAIIERWPAAGEHYAADAYRAAFGAVLVVQVLGYGWLLRNAWRTAKAPGAGGSAAS
jgi:MFS family permease